MTTIAEGNKKITGDSTMSPNFLEGSEANIFVMPLLTFTPFDIDERWRMICLLYCICFAYSRLSWLLSVFDHILRNIVNVQWHESYEPVPMQDQSADAAVIGEQREFPEFLNYVSTWALTWLTCMCSISVRKWQLNNCDMGHQKQQKNDEWWCYLLRQHLPV